MAKAKRSRTDKRQRGEFLTPPSLAKAMIRDIDLWSCHQILEPSFGNGSFLIAIIERLKECGHSNEEIHDYFSTRIYGNEINEALFDEFREAYRQHIGVEPPDSLANGDFFRANYLKGQFDFIIGNPPFGGTFDREIEDILDATYGRWRGRKLKKETYSFFVARCLDWLGTDGTLKFICSDTFLTISTMSGLRRRLMDQCENSISKLSYFSDEVTIPTLVLTSVKRSSNLVFIDSKPISHESIEVTQNLSWAICEETRKYFQGPLVGDYLLASSGMTTGNNELFIKEIIDGNTLLETYSYAYENEPITLQGEIARARLGKIPRRKVKEIEELQSKGATRKVLRTEKLSQPYEVKLPNPYYKLYNKARSERFYASPKYAIYWANNGEAVLTYKKSGPWYLHGVGGAKFFEKEGLTWSLVSTRFTVRYLPAGYILDSGAPIGILREKIDRDELFFMIGWLNTSLARKILKTVINHTRNIHVCHIHFGLERNRNKLLPS